MYNNMNISIRFTIISKREEEGSVTPDQEQVHHDVLPQGRDQQVQVQGGRRSLVDRLILVHFPLYKYRALSHMFCRHIVSSLINLQI